MNPTKKTMKKVKAFAVTGKTLSAFGTIVDDITNSKNVWQFPIFTNKKEAKSWKIQKGWMCEDYSIVPCTITYKVITNKAKSK